MKIKITIALLMLTVIILPSMAQEETQKSLPDGAIARLGKGKITVLKFTHDGRHMAVGTDIGVWVYDVNTGKVKRLLTPHPRGVDNIVISPDQRTLASSGCKSPVILLWDIHTGKRINTLRSELNIDGSAMAFTKDGKHLIGLYSNLRGENILLSWDVSTGEIISKKRSKGVFSPLSCDQNSSTFVGVTREGKITLLNPDITKDGVVNNNRIKSIISNMLKKDNNENKRPNHGIYSLTFSPDGNKAASGGEDRVIRLWDTSTLTEEAILKGHIGWITAIAISPDNSIVASGDTDKTILLWDMQTGQPISTLNGHSHTINVLAFTPDGHTVASGSLDGTIRLWNVKTGKEMSIIATDHTTTTRSVAFTNDSKLCVTSTYNGAIQSWDVNTGHRLNSISIGPIAKTNAMTLSPDATLFAFHGNIFAFIVPARNGYHVGRTASQGNDNTRLWNLIDNKEMIPLQGGFRPNSLSFSPDNRILASVHTFQGPSLWEVINGNKLFEFNVRDKVIAFSYDSNLFATGGDSDITRIWNTKSGNEIISHQSVNAEFLAFSRDGSTLAIGTQSEIILWNYKAAQTSTSISMEQFTKINTLTLSPDGKTIIVGINAEENIRGRWKEHTIYGIQLWDIQTANLLGKHSGHSDKIDSLQFSHDGKILTSSSQDGTVILWDWYKILNKLQMKN